MRKDVIPSDFLVPSKKVLEEGSTGTKSDVKSFSLWTRSCKIEVLN